MRINFCELINIDIEIERERYLGKGLSIRRMPTYIGQFIDKDRGFSVSFPNRRWIIFGAQQRDYDGQPDWAIANNIRVLIDTLLLYCPETVDFGAQYQCEYYSKRKVKPAIKTTSGLLNEKSIGHNRMILTNRQVSQVREMFSLLMNVYDNHFIQIPLTFYREACKPYTLPWKVAVYLTIALESIFLSGETYNKAHEVAKRVADLLVQNSHHEDDTYRKVFALYKCRNAILHEGNQRPVVQLTDENTGAQFEFNGTDLTKSCYNIVQRCFSKILYTRISEKKTLLRLINQQHGRLRRPKLEFKILNGH